jgi:hypothetical protein
VTRGHGTKAHRCTGPYYGPFLLRLTKLLGESWSVCLPRGVAWRELVSLSASLSCSMGVGRLVRLVELLGGS